MQASGETDRDVCAYNDFALVEIAAGGRRRRQPEPPGLRRPDRHRHRRPHPGELVYSYGNSPLRLGISALSPKVGISVTDAGGGCGHEVYTLTPGVPGDSGSAFVDDDGRGVRRAVHAATSRRCRSATG